MLSSDSKVLQFSDVKQAVDEDIEKAPFAYKAVILTSEFWVASSEQTQGGDGARGGVGGCGGVGSG